MASDPPDIGWTIETRAYLDDALRDADLRFAEERDRRYAEVNVEREKALKIKETADRDALDLARERQREKDAQSDALRDKTLTQSGIYATNASVADAISELRTFLQPTVDFVNNARGAGLGSQMTKGNVYAFIGACAAIVVVLGFAFSSCPRSVRAQLQVAPTFSTAGSGG